MMGNNPKLDLVNVDAHKKVGQILSICSQGIERNEILTSIKGNNSVKSLQKLTGNNPKLHVDLVNVDKHTNFGHIYIFCQFVLKILSGNEIPTSIKGGNSVKIL